MYTVQHESVGTAYKICIDDLSEEQNAKGLLETKTFDIYYFDELAGRFSLSPMPGNCGMVVSTGMEIFAQHRDKRISNPIHKLKFELARRLGYTIICCTVQCTNFKEVASLLTAGYKVGHTFRNKRTNNDIFYMYRQV